MHLTPLFIPASPLHSQMHPPSSLTIFHAMIKAYTQYKSSALFYGYTFSRFYVITEIRQIKFPHHHPAPLDKHCSENESSFLSREGLLITSYNYHHPSKEALSDKTNKPFLPIFSTYSSPENALNTPFHPSFPAPFTNASP